jgi:hypothetical protein
MNQTTNGTRETKVCSKCLRDWPLSWFRRRKRDSERRHTHCRWCRWCYRQYFRRRREAERLKKINPTAKRLTKQSDAEILGSVTTDLVRRFGGLDAFCRQFKAGCDAASAAAIPRRPCATARSSST